VGDCAVNNVQAALADFLHFDGGFFPAFCGVVGDNFRSLGESMEGVFRACGSGLGPADSSLGDECNVCSVPSAVLTTMVLVASSTLVIVP
jgi:hypothetical protein